MKKFIFEVTYCLSDRYIYKAETQEEAEALLERDLQHVNDFSVDDVEESDVED